jgi:hypothetical protein
MKRDGDRRVHERPPKMLGDDEFDKKSYWRSFWKLSTEVTIFEIESFDSRFGISAKRCHIWRLT